MTHPQEQPAAADWRSRRRVQMPGAALAPQPAVICLWWQGLCALIDWTVAVDPPVYTLSDHNLIYNRLES